MYETWWLTEPSLKVTLLWISFAGSVCASFIDSKVEEAESYLYPYRLQTAFWVNYRCVNHNHVGNGGIVSEMLSISKRQIGFSNTQTLKINCRISVITCFCHLHQPPSSGHLYPLMESWTQKPSPIPAGNLSWPLKQFSPFWASLWFC